MDVTPRRSWTGPDPDDIVAWSVVRAGHVLGRRFHVAFGDVGLTPTQFGVLLQLDLTPGMSNADLARVVLVTPQSMSDLLASLEELGLVERVRPAGRGHRVPTTLTSSGRAILARCVAAVAAVESSLGLSAEQRQALACALDTVLGTDV